MKAMLIVFFNIKGIILIDGYMRPNQSIRFIASHDGAKGIQKGRKIQICGRANLDSSSNQCASP